MTDGRGNELAEAMYPLVATAGVTIPEEFACLLAAGWTWDGDRLVHPEDKSIWRMYTRINSPKVVESGRLDAEIEQAVRGARWKE